MSSFFSDGLSVNETKVSLLMVSFAVTLGFALWQFATIGVIDGSMLTLLAYEIGAITGMNIVESIRKPKNNDHNIGA